MMSDNLRGALLMVGSMAAFSLGDAAVKATGGAVPLSQILVLRGLMATAFIAALAWWLGALRFDLPRREWRLMLFRAASEVGAAFFFLTALLNMPLANLTALLQMLPLTVTLGSALVFGEAVGWRRWSAIALGFIGMLLIVKPGAEGFTIWSLYGLASVACVTLRDLTTRRMSRQTPSLMVTLVSAALVTAFGGLWSFRQDWVALSPDLGGLIAAATACVIAGYCFSVMVMRVGDIGFVAPFRYTGLLWAMLLGFLIFDHVPGPWTLAGGGIIMATGLFTMMRERQLKARRT